MKIIYVITKWKEHGGAQYHVRLLAERMQSVGHEVLVVSGPEGHRAEQPQSSSIEDRIIPTMGRGINLIKDFQALLSLVRILRKEKPDLVSGHSSKAGLLGAIASRVSGIPYVYTAHSWAFLQSSSRLRNTLYLFLWRTLGRLVRHVICVSDFDRKIALQYGIVQSENTWTVLNGLVDLENDSEPISRFSGDVRAISVGRLSEPKDFPFLISVIARTEQIFLDIVGQGPQRGYLERLIKDLDVGNRVRFLGDRKDVPELMSGYDLVVLMSKSEGLPFVVLEGMRALKPVVASRVGGIGEVIIDGETGFLVDIGDSETLFSRLTQLADNANLRKKLGEAGRERFLNKFLVEPMFSKTINIYGICVRNHHQSKRDGDCI